MAESEMVERVARAICRGVGQVRPDVILTDEPAWHQYIYAARAAIEAMREPTPEMLRAAQTTHASYLRAATDAEIWQAMIRAALSSPRVSDNSALGED
jgi:hypothetical protein